MQTLNSEFEIGTKFESLDKAEEYGVLLSGEIGKQQDIVDKAVVGLDEDLADKIDRFEDLKQAGTAIITKYFPNTAPLGVTEDEYFRSVEEGEQRTLGVEHNSAGYAQIIPVVIRPGIPVAKIGYDHPCPLVPILTCGTDVGSGRTVTVPSGSDVSFVGYAAEDNGWIMVWQHLALRTSGAYSGTTLWNVDGEKNTVTWTQSKPWWTDTVKIHAATYGSTSCGYNPVSENTVINALVGFRAVS